MKLQKDLDLTILGGGPAGMTAAIFAARANLRCSVVESNICGGLVNSTYLVENFPSHKSIHGMDLMQKMAEQMEALGVGVEEVAEVTNLSLRGAVKEIETEECVYRAPAVILATGRMPLSLDVDTRGLDQIHYCSVCDGSAYKGKKVLVVGGGNSGFDEALYLLSLGVREIRLVEMMDRFFAADAVQKKLLGHENVTVSTSTKVESLIGSKRLEAVRLENLTTGQLETVEVDGVFVFMGQKPNTAMFAHEIELDGHGYILANQNMETNLAGVYAAGDVRCKEFRYITTAVADGTIAALCAERFIRK